MRLRWRMKFNQLWRRLSYLSPAATIVAGAVLGITLLCLRFLPLLLVGIVVVHFVSKWW